MQYINEKWFVFSLHQFRDLKKVVCGYFRESLCLQVPDRDCGFAFFVCCINRNHLRNHQRRTQYCCKFCTIWIRQLVKLELDSWRWKSFSLPIRVWEENRGYFIKLCFAITSNPALPFVCRVFWEALIKPRILFWMSLMNEFIPPRYG
jgi:hypothetical protein